MPLDAYAYTPLHVCNAMRDWIELHCIVYGSILN